MSGIYYNLLNDKAILTIGGEDAKQFLQAIISNDINKVSADNSIYACLLTPQGKYLHDFFISEFTGQLWLEVNAVRMPDLIKRLQLYKLRSKVEIRDVSANYAVIQLWGKDVWESIGVKKLPGNAQEFIGGKAFADPRAVTMGIRAFMPKDRILEVVEHKGFKQDALGYDRLRIENAIPEGEKDLIAEKSFPLEYGFEELQAIDFNKGCYVGQEVISRTKHRGVVRKKVFKISSDQASLQPGAELSMGENKVGMVCSVCGNIGLALIRVEDYLQGKELNLELKVSGQEQQQITVSESL